VLVSVLIASCCSFSCIFSSRLAVLALAPPKVFDSGSDTLLRSDTGYRRAGLILNISTDTGYQQSYWVSTAIFGISLILDISLILSIGSDTGYQPDIGYWLDIGYQL